ncbi:hypothetical protein IGS68_12315 [Skermanella sp. TT6]|uniref:Uncharacterized protein n=1 Tax=Skermanella cutis TaxID=2775420 RepID=A0ABX7BC12_9PROT|nr:hypothetical protein [Skermanella sp. TT6]QQP91934.1 hypothetical protein IGS68_12315 [Skermanella sp. TT6]
MLKLGTRVGYGDQVGRIVGRTIELQPKYDIMLANGTIRSYVREVDLVLVPLPSDRPLVGETRGPMSMRRNDVNEEERDADPDRGR